MISKKQKKICKTHFVERKFIEHILILASTITRCVSISAFASLDGIPIGITSPAIG